MRIFWVGKVDFLTGRMVYHHAYCVKCHRVHIRAVEYRRLEGRGITHGGAFKDMHRHDHKCHWVTHRRLDSIHIHKYPKKCLGGWLRHLFNSRTCKHNVEDKGSAPTCDKLSFRLLSYTLSFLYINLKKKISCPCAMPGYIVFCLHLIATNKKSSPSFPLILLAHVLFHPFYVQQSQKHALQDFLPNFSKYLAFMIRHSYPLFRFFCILSSTTSSPRKQFSVF